MTSSFNPIGGLPELLQRVAALRGIALPETPPVQTAAGDRAVTLEGVRALFDKTWPECTSSLKPLRHLTDEDFPALLVEAERVLVARHRESNGALRCEHAIGGSISLTPSGDQAGLVLTAGRVTSGARKARDQANLSAQSWFWAEIRRHMGSFAEVAVGALVANVLALATALFSMQVYDRVLPNSAYQTLWVLAVGVGLAILFEFVIRTARAHLLDRACKKIDLALSESLFRHVLGIRMDARPAAVGTLAAQVRDFEVVRSFLTSSTLFALADAPFVALFLGVIWMIGGDVVLVAVAALVVIILAGLLAQLPMARLSRLHTEESNERNGLLIEAIDGAKMVKATGAEWQFSRRWADLTAQISEDGLRIRAISNTLSTVGMAVQQMAYIGVVVVGAYLIGQGKLSVGALIACSILTARVLSPIGQITSLAFQWNHARIALAMLNQLMALPTDRATQKATIVRDMLGGLLQGSALRFRYGREGPPVLAVDRLQIAPGERIAIVGASGSGKSTLLNLMSGLYAPTEGQVRLGGTDVAAIDSAEVRRAIAYLPQEIRLFRGTLRDNLALGLSARSEDEVRQAAIAAGLGPLIERHPKGLGIELSEGGQGLSGGQRQAVGLARALLAGAPIILLDEPTASMDPTLEILALNNLLSGLRADQTLVCVTHKTAVIQAMDRLILMDQGRIRIDGPRDEVLKQIAGAPVPRKSVA